ncbi:MAG: hypothetical protein EP326_11895 [Deltaproteobacteria bacterium]|nr:MAG: hypothetical protein EP326_11895 [Deltaproteobacteria bacterium]TNF31408.1 MAG: hypothetical protein EP319_02265 [Deltaproteobacteria bacterium]
MNQRLAVHLKTSLKQLGLVLILCALQWVFFNIIMSVVTFFHFKLDHGLNIINEWVFYNGWEIVTLTKLFSVWIFLKFLMVSSSQRSPIKNLFLGGIVFPGKEILIALGGIYFFFIFAGGGNLDPSFKGSFVQSVLTFFAVIFYYMSTVIILLGIQKQYPLREKYRLLLAPLIALIILALEREIFPFAKAMNSLVFSNLVLCQFLIGWRKYNWSLPSIFILGFIAPCAVLTGLDPVYGKEYSLFNLSQNIGGVLYFVILFLSASYLIYKRKTDKTALLA